MPSTNRRELLSALSAASGAVTLSGCSAVFSEQSPSLVSVTLRNEHEQAHEVYIAVAAGGETAVEREFEALPDSSHPLPCEWPADASAYTITVTVNGTEYSETVEGEADRCLVPTVRREDGVQFRSWLPCPPANPERARGVEEPCYYEQK